MGMMLGSKAHVCKLLNHEILEFFIRFLVFGQCLFGLINLANLTMNNADMIWYEVHNAAFDFLHLRYISLAFDASIHHP
jgi:hypothetical protein